MHINEKRLITQVTFANAVELAAAALGEVMGEDIANRIDGELLDGDLLRDTLAAQLQKLFARYLGDVK
jgi:hypothetical protein